MSKLKSVTIPGTVKTIGGHAFSGCKNLKKVILPKGLEIIDDSAFSGCPALETIDLPDNVSRIGQSAFAVSGLKVIKLPANLGEIEYRAFDRCSSLTSIYIPVGVKDVSWQAFRECTSLKHVYYGGTLEQWVEIPVGTNNGYFNSATVHYNSKPSDLK